MSCIALKYENDELGIVVNRFDHLMIQSERGLLNNTRTVMMVRDSIYQTIAVIVNKRYHFRKKMFCKHHGRLMFCIFDWHRSMHIIVMCAFCFSAKAATSVAEE